ncbi:methyltransferase domain-containing protein [Streptomyces pini]|uniref:Methyltransferase domain-containing protein n=1 Tax=Streptomyces pini TaxID=1520580 RepID=A0A1I4CJ79_9ACTN|nr:class I SAM-dependent methyltransferase [Streptomyces pini]SFK80965.1 Methyltransferase domain-containing protein [Streptomyces pini]
MTVSPHPPTPHPPTPHPPTPHSSTPHSSTPRPRTAAPENPGDAAEATGRHPWRTDPYTRALRAGRGPLFLRRADGRLLPLEVERWCAGADEADLTVLRRCTGAVLDIGCGPGRLVTALAELGRPALGVDTAPAAVGHTRERGGAALCRSVFEPLPGEGRWGSALLIDGNIGVGGDPAALLARVRELLAPGGLLLAEAAPAEVEERFQVRLDDGSGARSERHAPLFPWARLGRRALRALAGREGWTVVEEWSAYGRFFLSLRAAAPAAAIEAVTSAVADTASSHERS